MARVSLALGMIFALTVLCACITENAALRNSISIPVPTNGRIQALQGRKCLNFLWERPCDHPYCKVTLEIKLKRNGGSSSVSQEISYKPTITNNNSSFAQCLYDSFAKENVSCCNSIDSRLKFTDGLSESFSNNEEISFVIKTCINESGNCVIKPGFDFVLPWYNPCFFDNPCQNGVCNPAVNSYNCSCQMNWKDENCSVPEDMTHHPDQCLVYPSLHADVKHHMMTLKDCRMECLSLGSERCKAFEFKKMSLGNNGNCTLRNGNSHSHDVTPCLADLYEFKIYLKDTSNGSTLTLVTFHVLIMFLATIFLTT